jgi:hypothetical protein
VQLGEANRCAEAGRKQTLDPSSGQVADQPQDSGQENDRCNEEGSPPRHRADHSARCFEQRETEPSKMT